MLDILIRSNEYSLYESIVEPVLGKCNVTYIGNKFTKISKDYIAERNSQIDLKGDLHIVTNIQWFNAVTKRKANKCIGYIINNYIYLPSPSLSFNNSADYLDKLDIVKRTIESFYNGTYSDPGSNIFKTEVYPTGSSIKEELDKLLTYPKLTCDIETWSLKFYEAGICSIAFAWNQYEGVAFRVDIDRNTRNEEIRNYLRDFFINYTGKLIFHNIAYDATVLIYQLFMDYLTDKKGLLFGLNTLMYKFEDTMIITYLATNNADQNKLSLKDNSIEFAGDYAQEDIDDCSKIPDDQLLKYNLTDVLATWYVYHKRTPKMLKDKQARTYVFFKKILSNIVQMQLNGIPINHNRALEVADKLKIEEDNARHRIVMNKYTMQYVIQRNQRLLEEYNNTHKKQKTILDFNEGFNPNSANQKIELLYNLIGLPILATTDSGSPSTKGDVLKDLLNHTKDQDVLDLLQAFIDYIAVVKINTAFMPLFVNAPYDEHTKWNYLFGSLHIGGTVSGRLSSSDPNLQNLPSTGSKYASIVKSIISAPPGWIYCGLDFDSLEDHISALLTKDTNKLLVYTSSYDGHSLRAFSYFRDQMPDIKMVEDQSEGCYEVELEDSTIWISDTDIIDYQGTRYTGKELINYLRRKE